MSRHDHASPSLDSSHLDYCDVTWFLLAVALLGLALHVGVAARWLPATCLTNPLMAVQSVIMILLVLSLAITVRLRAHRSPMPELGWRIIGTSWWVIAVAGGMIMAIVVTLVVGHRYPLVPQVGVGDGIVLAVLLAPLLEESFFRGCLLPVIARSVGPAGAVILTSLVFGFFHHPPTLLHFICFTLAGGVYAWMRIVSRSTMAAALMHAFYNLVLLTLPRLGPH